MKDNEQIRAMLTMGEVALFFKVHPDTVRRWNDGELIRAYRIGPRGDRRFRRDDVAAFLLERATRGYTKATSKDRE